MADLSKITLGDYLGKPAEGFLTTLAAAQLDETSNRFIIGEYIRDKSGKSLRTFRLSAGATVAAADAACVSAFAPSFQHREWRDGEDLVEAEGVNGFNVRFNALRADLDGIKVDLTKAFDCLAALQKAVAGALAEVTVELNTINRQIYDCCSTHSPGPIVVDPRPERPGVAWPPVVDWPVRPGPLDPRVVYPVDPRVLYTNPAYSDPLRRYGDTVWRDATNPNKGLIQGLPADRIDTTTFNGKSMDVWKTDMGLILTDSAPEAAPGKSSFVPNELEGVREFNRFLGDNADAVKTKFPNGFTVKEFTEEFGGSMLAGNTPVADLVKGLPDDMRFDAADKLSDTVAETTAKALAETGQGQAALVGSVGLNPAEDVDKVAIGSLKFADEATTKALKDGGVRTLGDLAAADPAAIKTLLDNAGVATTLGQASGLRGMGRTLTRIGRAGP